MVKFSARTVVLEWLSSSLAGTTHHALAGVTICLWLVVSPLFFLQHLIYCPAWYYWETKEDQIFFMNSFEVAEDRVLIDEVKVVRNYLALVPVEH